MATRMQWLGHSTLLIEGSGRKVLIDPFFTDNPAATARPEAIEADAILVSHGHFDHLGDAVAIARRLKVPVVAVFELANWLAGQGVETAVGMNLGGGSEVVPGVHVKLTVAHHSSTLPGGGSGGASCGFLITFDDGTKVYDAADTALFGDMKLIGDEGLDLAAVPIGDHFTMGVADSIRAIKLLQPKQVVPIHYDTFPPIQQDAHAWAERVKEETAAHPIVPRVGEWFDVR